MFPNFSSKMNMYVYSNKIYIFTYILQILKTEIFRKLKTSRLLTSKMLQLLKFLKTTN